MLLDTSFLIDLMNGDDGAVDTAGCNFLNRGPLICWTIATPTQKSQLESSRTYSRQYEKAEELERNLVQQRLSAMTLFELYYGVGRVSQPDAERRKIENVIASKPVHPADSTVMRTAGRLAGSLAADGTPVEDGDVIVGATAEVISEPVLTRNVADFERLGVEIESY